MNSSIIREFVVTNNRVNIFEFLILIFDFEFEFIREFVAINFASIILNFDF